MMKEKVLVVEDEPDILDLVTFHLKKEGFRVTGVDTGEEAIKRIPQIEPDLVIVDWMLPGLDGLDLCKFIKQNNNMAKINVMMLTAKVDESDIVTGLEIGADDYLTKPFSPKVLVARVKALLRRNREGEKDSTAMLQVDDLVIHPGKHEVRLGDKELKLTNMEFRILHFLASHQGWVYTRSQIVAAVRGEDYAVTDRSVDAIIVGLRKKLGRSNKLIETVRGVGYRFKDST